MAWVKIPKEHHALFREGLPVDPAVDTVNMFGGLAALVNGNMFAGLFARSAIVKLDAAGQAQVLAMEGGAPFDPMGNGRIMKDTVVLPEAVMDDARELRRWLGRAFASARTLPPKKKRKKKKQSSKAKVPRAAPKKTRAASKAKATRPTRKRK